MKKNKILAGISALVMGATMMAGTAMSASAATVTGSVTGNGGFWAYYYGTDDGVTYTTDWHKAPFGMYDGNINGTVTSYYDASVPCNKVDFDLKPATYSVHGNSYYGYVTDIYNTTDGSVVVDDDSDGVPDRVEGMKVGVEYTLTTSTGMSPTIVKFVIS